MKHMGLTLILIACGTIFLLWLYVDAAVRYPEIYGSSGRDPVVRTVCACFLLVYIAGYLLFHRNGHGPWGRR
jgi:hypothetical protein